MMSIPSRIKEHRGHLHDESPTYRTCMIVHILEAVSRFNEMSTRNAQLCRKLFDNTKNVSQITTAHSVVQLKGDGESMPGKISKSEFQQQLRNKQIDLHTYLNELPKCLRYVQKWREG